MEEVKEKKRVDSAETAVFPVVLDIIPSAVFNVKSPIVLGVRVIEGVARVGTPLCIPSKDFLFVGRITGIQKNHVDFQDAKKGEEFGQYCISDFTCVKHSCFYLYDSRVQFYFIN